MRILVALAAVSALAAGPAALRPPQHAVQDPWLDPAALVYTQPSQIHWVSDPVGAQTAVIAGDPARPGLYVMLVKWSPHHMSQPHWHPHNRYITVLSGTWWVGTGAHFDPGHTVAMPPGSVVTHFARHVHYDGAKDGGCILEIVGEGPATANPAATASPGGSR
ncbi:MAG: cupin domain-containing protein [Terriglobales bacterium]